MMGATVNRHEMKYYDALLGCPGEKISPFAVKALVATVFAIPILLLFLLVACATVDENAQHWLDGKKGRAVVGLQHYEEMKVEKLSPEGGF